LEAGVACRGAPRLVSRGVGGRVALCGGRVTRRVCRGGRRRGGPGGVAVCGGVAVYVMCGLDRVVCTAAT